MTEEEEEEAGMDDHCQMPRGGKGKVSLAHIAGMMRSRQTEGEIFSWEGWRQMGSERRGLLLLEVKGRRVSELEFGGLAGRAEARQMGRRWK